MRPCLLASLERWNPTEHQASAIRERLRDLGVQLIVMSNVGTAVISPTEKDVLVEAPEALARKAGLELSVISADGASRTYVCPSLSEVDPEEALVQALQAVEL